MMYLGQKMTATLEIILVAYYKQNNPTPFSQITCNVPTAI
jgi:hypothetical protein